MLSSYKPTRFPVRTGDTNRINTQTVLFVWSLNTHTRTRTRTLQYYNITIIMSLDTFLPITYNVRHND